jgi:hypothetical protein
LNNMTNINDRYFRDHQDYPPTYSVIRSQTNIDLSEFCSYPLRAGKDQELPSLRDNITGFWEYEDSEFVSIVEWIKKKCDVVQHKLCLLSIGMATLCRTSRSADLTRSRRPRYSRPCESPRLGAHHGRSRGNRTKGRPKRIMSNPPSSGLFRSRWWNEHWRV